MDDFRPTSSTAHHHPHPEELLSPLEQEVLDEYAKLVGNLDDVFLSLFFSFSFPFLRFLQPTYLLTYLLYLSFPIVWFSSVFFSALIFWPLTDSKNVIMMKL